MHSRLWAWAAWIGCLTVGATGQNQTPGNWHYRLLEGSTLLDDCAVCDRVPIYEPLRGGFDLTWVSSTPISERYRLSNIHWRVGTAEEPSYELTGEGEVEVRGEVALIQEWQLALVVRKPTGGGSLIQFESRPAGPERVWPNLGVGLVDPNGTEHSTLHLQIFAAPFRELWFLTEHGMTPGLPDVPGPYVAQGNVLSEKGRLVVRKDVLLEPLQLDPPPAALRIDALEVRSGLLFSLEEDARSEPVGAVHHGDLLRRDGRERSYLELIRPFSPQPPIPDLGLDAIHFLDDPDGVTEEICFSIREGVFSQRLGRWLAPGDLLAVRFRAGSEGEPAVKRTQQELLARFHPDLPDRDRGLDALFIWPNGEVWFSTEESFEDARLGWVSDGDLLSDQGHLVFRNLELVSRFSPLEDLANFGLRGLHVVTDVGSRADGSVVKPPRVDRTTGDVTLAWDVGKAPGRIFQVERTAQIGLPFAPVSPFLFAPAWVDAGGWFEHPAAFYRVRSW